MKDKLKKFAALLILITLFSSALSGQVKLPALVSDGMILQRNTPLIFWGWASPGERVTVHFLDRVSITTTDEKGTWQVTFPGQKAGGPYEIEIYATNQITIHNVLIGDVWLCSGQSNMEYYFARLTDKYAEEIAESENNEIRQFRVPYQFNFRGPQQDYPSGKWVMVNPTSILDFSAVAYFFALELHRRYDVPVGIINASMGGSPAEAWMSRESLRPYPELLAEADRFGDSTFTVDLRKKEQQAIADWYRELDSSDRGLHAMPTWKEPSFDTSKWPEMPVPSWWADHGPGEMNGVVWFRKVIDLPASFIGTETWIRLGRIVDADSVFINGHYVGSTSYQYPQRKYKLPPGLLREGMNTIVVRVINNSGRGGFEQDKPYDLVTMQDTLDISGMWKYRVGCTTDPMPGQTFVRFKPTGLYNGMIAPSNKYRIRGVVWYQGESNANRYTDYEVLLTNLIRDWRQNREQGNFPFLVVQLPNFMGIKEQPSESSWAELRDDQLRVTRSVQNTMLTVNTDLGEWNDIHPQNKLDVGKRLARAACYLAYGERDVVPTGPIWKSAKFRKEKIIISFKYTGDSLVARGGQLRHFALAGTDGKFKWARAEIKGKRVIVYNDQVDNPVAVRYGWADNPERANLYNSEELPASPFMIRKHP